MKISKLFSDIFALLAIVLALATIITSIVAVNTAPSLVKASDEALDTLDLMMSAVAEGDYNEAGALMYGMPDLGVHDAADEVGQFVWDSFVDSITYELVGELHAGDTGLAQKVKFTSLDMKAVAAKLGDYAEAMLEKRVEEAEDMDQVYDEENNYREDFVMSVLRDAAEMALKEHGEYIEQEITLNLVFKQGQWWVMPEQQLLSAISGGIAG